MRAHLEAQFPNLRTSGYAETSPAASEYNCVAWAAGDDSRWWWPSKLGGGYWPPNAPREETVASFIEAFATLGYEQCNDATLEDMVEKVAIYTTEGIPMHIARQLPDGHWTSKCGMMEDITHSLVGLEQSTYGSAAVFLARAILK